MSNATTAHEFVAAVLSGNPHDTMLFQPVRARREGGRGMTVFTAETDAEGLEHHLSEETLEAMRRFSDERSGAASPDGTAAT